MLIVWLENVYLVRPLHSSNFAHNRDIIYDLRDSPLLSEPIVDGFHTGYGNCTIKFTLKNFKMSYILEQGMYLFLLCW